MGVYALIESSASLHRVAREMAWSGAVPQQIRERANMLLNNAYVNSVAYVNVLHVP